MGRGQAGRAHKGAVNNADAGDLRGSGPTVPDFPVGQIRLREQVAQETGSGPAARPPVGLGQNVQVFYFQQVAGSRPLDVDGAGQGMGYLGVQVCQIRRGHSGLNLIVGSVPGFQQNLLARGHFQDGRQVGMPAVMALCRLLFQPLGAVDSNAFHFPHLRRWPAPYVALGTGRAGLF